MKRKCPKCGKTFITDRRGFSHFQNHNSIYKTCYHCNTKLDTYKRVRPFTRFDKFAGYILGNVLRFLAGRNYFFCYEGSCDRCGAPIHKFIIEVIGRYGEDDTRVYHIAKSNFICEGCGGIFNSLGIYKTYDVSKEFNHLHILCHNCNSAKQYFDIKPGEVDYMPWEYWELISKLRKRGKNE